jgi:hypothetical protein
MTDVIKIISVVGPIVGIFGLIFGLYQYFIAQKWKRAEFAAKELEKLSSDPELELCCKLLDWSVREVAVPEKYKLLAEEEKFVHDWRILAEAMLPEEDKCSYTWQHTLYRDLFDHFFDYLERINHYITINLISTKDVSSLDYWLEQIASPRFLDESKKNIFLGFISRYDYDGVIELMKKFQITK